MQSLLNWALQAINPVSHGERCWVMVLNHSRREIVEVDVPDRDALALTHKRYVMTEKTLVIGDES